MNLTLAEIAKACSGELVLSNCEQNITTTCEQYINDTRVTSVVLDSRKVEEGGVFVATLGERVDGHKFLADIYAKGAALALVQKTPKQVEEEHGIDPAQWGNYCLVEDTLQALKDIAAFYRSQLSAKIIGITGSVGKTSTKEFIAGVLSEKYHVLKTEGNFNNEIGVPLTLLRIRPEHEIAVVEMGISDFGEMSRLGQMARPDVCVITNIGQCHLENLKDRDGVLKAKTEMFDYLTEDAEVCLNGEDDKLAGVADVNGKRPHFFGLGGNEAEQVWASDIVSHGLFGSDAILHIRNAGEIASCGEACDCSHTTDNDMVNFPVQVPQPGNHMVLNAAAATCVARLFDMTSEEISAGISRIAPVSGRSHLIQLSDYTLIDDCYNANPVSMRAALDLLALADTKKIAILGDMFELGEDALSLHASVGAYAAERGVDLLICIGEQSYHMCQAAVEKTQSPEKPEHGAALKTARYFATKQAFIEAYQDAGESLLPKHSTILLKASHGMGFAELVELLCKEQKGRNHYEGY